MVYTQARLDEALSAFRECKKFIQRRGLKTANLEHHLGRKYELRKPPPVIAFAPRTTLWDFRDDNSDSEFEPTNGRKKKKNVALKPKPARLPKRKLSVSGEDSGCNKRNCRRKPKGITLMRGRRVGLEDIQIFKFIKPESLQVLDRLFPPDAPGSEKMPHKEPINVFNANAFDSGFKVISPSDLNLNVVGPLPRYMSGLQAGTIIDPSAGLVTPRGSISSIEALQASSKTQFAIAGLPAFADEPTRDLRNRVVPTNLAPFKKRYTCLTCKEEDSRCSLIKSHQDFQGACDACKLADSPCRINEDDEPRMGPLDRMDLARENKKRSAEGDGGRDSKRREFSNKNIGSIFGDGEEFNPSLGNSMLKKRKGGKRNNLQLINELKRGSKPGFSGRDFESSLPVLDTSLANSFPDSKSSDSGYHSSFLTSSAQTFNINMSNTVDTAISILSSPSSSTSSLFFSDPSLSRSFSPDPPEGTTTRITTPWAHPIDFQHRPKATGAPCHFCQDFRYGLVGLGPTTVEVAWDQDEKNYIEISDGHFGMGKETTRMCVACSLERLRIRFCGYGHDLKGKGKGKADQRKRVEHHHQLIEMPTWRTVGHTRNQQWTKQLQMKTADAGFSTQPVLPPCHLCMMPATYRCGTVQKRNPALQPLEGEAMGKPTCGLRVCDGCKENVEGCGREWIKGKVLGMGERADAEFLFQRGMLERSKSWEGYLRSVGLLE